MSSRAFVPTVFPRRVRTSECLCTIRGEQPGLDLRMPWWVDDDVAALG
ncbi:hypothetical protein [Nocardia sp. NPDC050710]